MERAQTMVVRTGLKAGKISVNHCGVALRTAVKAGRVTYNHSAAEAR